MQLRAERVPNGGDALAPPDVPIAIDAHAAPADARPDAEPIDAAQADRYETDASDDTDGDSVR